MPWYCSQSILQTKSIHLNGLVYLTTEEYIWGICWRTCQKTVLSLYIWCCLDLGIPTGLISLQAGKPQSPMKPVSMVATVNKSGPSPGKRSGSSPPDLLRNVWSHTGAPVLASFGDAQTWLGWAELLSPCAECLVLQRERSWWSVHQPVCSRTAAAASLQ